jgi:high-affinity iron transporter
MFFKVTSLVLLFSAAGLIVTGASRLIEADVLPSLIDPVWNTAWIIDGGSKVGGIIATFTGYRSRPSLMIVLIYAAYWLLTWAWIKKDQWTTARHPSKLAKLSQTQQA